MGFGWARVTRAQLKTLCELCGSIHHEAPLARGMNEVTVAVPIFNSIISLAFIQSDAVLMVTTCRAHVDFL